MMGSTATLLLTGAALSQGITFLVYFWRKEVRDDQIRNTLGPPAP
ncbi:MAG: hypothetical protein ABF876_05340 [Acetobacter aceti]